MHKKNSKILYYIQFIFIIISAFFMGYMLDLSQTGSMATTNQILFHTNVPTYLITALVLFLIYMAFYGIFNRFFYSTALFYVLFSIYSVANKLKMQYRSEPILPSDMQFLSHSKELLSMISTKLVIVVILITLVVITLCIILEKIFAGQLLRFKPISRIVMILLGALSIGSLYNVNEENSLTNTVMTAAGYSNFTPNIALTTSTNGPLLTFLGNIHINIMDKPAGYSKETMQQLVKKYQQTADEINQDRPNKNINKQTLIFILSESFSDPSRVPNIHISGGEPAPKIMNIKQNNTSGLMLSSGYGGGTANMEYMTFTGLAYNQFSKSLQSPYTQLVTKQDHPVNIVNSFNKSAAIHPYDSYFYDRQSVYPKFGFQSFRNIDSKGNLALKYTDKIGSNPYVSDEASYKNALWQVNQEKSGQFISLVTMQNHMPYNVMYPDNQFVATGKGADIPQQVSNYAKEMSYTDNATQAFLDKLDQLQKPVTVVFYGDHLPGLYGKNLMSKYNLVQHETDYFVYSNKYALEHNAGTKKIDQSTEITDPNGFIPLALKQMKQQVTPYYAFLTKVQENLPAMAKNSVGKNESLYVNSQGKQVSDKDFTKSQKQLLHDYKLVQYDLTVGKGYSQSSINK